MTTKQIRLYKINGICVKSIIFKLCYKQIMGNRVEGLDKVDGYGNNTLSVISVILIRAIQQEWPFKKPDRLEEKCGDMAVYIWSNKTFSYTLDITGRIEMGRWFDFSFSCAFLWRGVTFLDFHTNRHDWVLMKSVITRVISQDKTGEDKLVALDEIFSIPTDFLGLRLSVWNLKARL